MMRTPKRLRVGAFQFAACESIEKNLAAIERGMETAAAENVRLLLTQECALCGYPPVEASSVASIDRNSLLKAYREAALLVQKHRMYLALGTITFDEKGTYNSLRLICPDGSELGPYHKRALWGWDQQNFTPGDETGIYTIDGVKVGVRICFEVRFPEYFRELFLEQVELALVAFADVRKEGELGRINTIRSHLVSRAAENVMYVVSANSTSEYQLAPTCAIDPDGNVIAAAPLNEEYLLATEIEITRPGFARQGRIECARALTVFP